MLEAEPVIHLNRAARSQDRHEAHKFLPSLAEVPTKELEALKERAVKSGFDFIDFWAVDFDWQPGKPSTITGRTTAPARTAASRRSATRARIRSPGKHTVCVR